MSHVPAKIRTTPAHRSWPKATRNAAANVSATPTTVTWFGVKGTRPTADIRASALRRTQVSNRVVNMSLPWLPGRVACGLARFFVNLDHLCRDSIPGVPAGLFVPERAHPTSQLGVPSQDDQRRTELSPSLRAHRQAVAAGLQHRHVAGDLGGDDRQARGHRLQEDDAEALGAGRGSAEDVRAGVVTRLDRVWDVARHHHVGEPVAGDVRLDPAPQGSVADDDQAGLRHALSHELIAAKQVAQPLSLLQPSDEELSL